MEVVLLKILPRLNYSEIFSWIFRKISFPKCGKILRLFWIWIFGNLQMQFERYNAQIRLTLGCVIIRQVLCVLSVWYFYPLFFSNVFLGSSIFVISELMDNVLPLKRKRRRTAKEFGICEKADGCDKENCACNVNGFCGIHFLFIKIKFKIGFW